LQRPLPAPPQGRTTNRGNKGNGRRRPAGRGSSFRLLRRERMSAPGRADMPSGAPRAARGNRAPRCAPRPCTAAAQTRAPRPMAGRGWWRQRMGRTAEQSMERSFRWLERRQCFTSNTNQPIRERRLTSPQGLPLRVCKGRAPGPPRPAPPPPPLSQQQQQQQDGRQVQQQHQQPEPRGPARRQWRRVGGR
jgi:hypothetical protein